MDITDIPPSFFRYAWFRKRSPLTPEGYVVSSNLGGRGARIDSGRSFVPFDSLWSEPDEYAESGGGVDFSGSGADSSGTARCFIRFERRLAKPVLVMMLAIYPSKV